MQRSGARNPIATETSLRGWLEQLRGRSAHERATSLVVGATGHLILSDTETANAQAHLRNRVLPNLIRRDNLEEIVLVTGAALGADMEFMRTTQDWLSAVGIRWRSVALLPVSVEQLYEDWQTRSRNQGVGGSARWREEKLQALRHGIASVDLRVKLFAEHEFEDFADPRWKTRQYQQLAACLAQQSDVLIAILRSQDRVAPGGTAEVVEWRCHPNRIPPQLSTWDDERHGRGPSNRLPLIVIDPTVSFGASALRPSVQSDEESSVIAQAEAALHAGNDLLCNDIAYRAARRGLNSPRLQYLRVLSLANAGNTEQALAQYRGLQLDTSEFGESWLALRGRLEKDLALRGTAQTQQHFRNAAAAYLDAYRRWGGSYSGVNAATMSLMGGEHESSRALAVEVLTQLSPSLPDDEEARYFRHVTEAEAALLSGDCARCTAQLIAANQLLQADASRRSRTVRQLRMICSALSVSPELLSALHLPPVVLIRRDEPWWSPELRPAQELEPLPPALRGALVFFGLSDLHDLALAEALLEIGARIYPVLPCPLRQLKRQCAERWGEDATARLVQALDRAEHVSAERGFLASEEGWCAQHLHTVATGLSLLQAQRLGNSWRLLRLPRSGDRLGCVTVAEIDADTEHFALAVSQTCPQSIEPSQPNPRRRRVVGLLFADFAGFRRITDDELPRFWDEIMRDIAWIVDACGDRVLARNTWGDALHLVTKDAATAAEIAADIQQYFEQRRRQNGGPIANLELRMALHYAAAYESQDPIRSLPTYYGSQLMFTARIEPVTPPGMVFGSEALAARLALEAPGRFSADYAGEIELAKRFGKYRLFAIRRRTGSKA